MYMKRLSISLLLVAALVVFASCASDSSKVKSFVEEFATAVANGDKGAIEKMYPDASKAVSLELKFNADSVEVTPAEKDGEFNVTVGKDVKLVVVKDADSGNFTIKESHGVFTWPKERMEFARSTGWYDDKLTDKDNAERLADEGFVDYLGNSLLADVHKKVYAKAISDLRAAVHGATYEVEVRNDNDFDLPGDAYVATATLWGFDFDRLESVPTRTKKEFSGNTVPAHGTARYNIPGTVDFEYESWEADIRITMSKEQLVTRCLKPTGKEYEEYLRMKGDVSTFSSQSGSQTSRNSSAGSSTDGLSLNLHGSIGGANDAIFTLSGINNDGFTSFTVSGVRNERKLRFGSYDKQSGKLIIQEYFTNGQYVGDFVGTYKNGVYEGVFTNTKGGKVNFRLQ